MFREGTGSGLGADAYMGKNHNKGGIAGVKRKAPERRTADILTVDVDALSKPARILLLTALRTRLIQLQSGSFEVVAEEERVLKEVVNAEDKVPPMATGGKKAGGGASGSGGSGRGPGSGAARKPAGKAAAKPAAKKRRSGGKAPAADAMDTAGLRPYDIACRRHPPHS